MIGNSAASMADRFKAVKNAFQRGRIPEGQQYGKSLLTLWLDLLEQDVTTKEGKTYAFRDGHIPKNVHVLVDYLGHFANEGMRDTSPPRKLIEYRDALDFQGTRVPWSQNRFIKQPTWSESALPSHSGDFPPGPRRTEEPLLLVFYTKDLDPAVHGQDPEYKAKEKQLRLSAIKAISSSYNAVFYDMDQQFLAGLATHTDPEYLEAFTTALINMQKQHAARDVLGRRLAKLQSESELYEAINRQLNVLGGSTAELPDLLAP